jgi:hypothetical protein
MNIGTTLKTWAKRIKRDGVTLWFAGKHPRTPWYAKALGLFVVAYALSPIDLIPDFIPVLGSPGAAGKLLHVLGEGLRRELQPFDHRQVGEQLVGQFLHRHAVAMASAAVWISSPASGATACTPISRPLPSSMPPA